MWPCGEMGGRLADLLDGSIGEASMSERRAHVWSPTACGPDSSASSRPRFATASAVTVK